MAKNDLRFGVFQGTVDEFVKQAEAGKTWFVNSDAFDGTVLFWDEFYDHEFNYTEGELSESMGYTQYVNGHSGQLEDVNPDEGLTYDDFESALEFSTTVTLELPYFNVYALDTGDEETTVMLDNTEEEPMQLSDYHDDPDSLEATTFTWYDDASAFAQKMYNDVRLFFQENTEGAFEAGQKIDIVLVEQIAPEHQEKILGTASVTVGEGNDLST